MGYSLQYYDLVLVCIAASLALGAIVSVATSVPAAIAVPVFATVGIGFIAHALFVNGPVDDTEDLAEEVPIEEVPQTLSPLESRPE